MVGQVVPGVRLAEAAPLPVVGVGGQPVVAATLNVDGRQVQGHGVGDLKPSHSCLGYSVFELRTRPLSTHAIFLGFFAHFSLIYATKLTQPPL